MLDGICHYLHEATKRIVMALLIVQMVAYLDGTLPPGRHGCDAAAAKGCAPPMDVT